MFSNKKKENIVATMSLFRAILLLTAALCLASCSSDTELEEQNVVDLRQPMVFGTPASQAETEVTRSSDLNSRFNNFKVGVWKAFGMTTQQGVMEGYEVRYTSTARTDAPDSYNWYYEDLNGQLLRYWDLGAFPYEFRAVAPYMSGATISPTSISIDVTSTPFRGQTYKDDVLNVTHDNSEPCLVAHVSRTRVATDYEDRDKIKNQEINTEGKANGTREVHMPFHHLISKIGFRIFIDNPMPLYNDYSISLQSIKITVRSNDNSFVTAANGYTATSDQGLGHGTFTGLTTNQGTREDEAKPYEYTLLEHGLYNIAEDSHRDFHYHLNKNDAFWLTPEECLHQIPQTGITLRVQATLKTHHVEGDDQTFTFDSVLSTENLRDTDIAEGDYFKWKPETKYIYYLHIPNLHGHEIYLNTCEILPWDEVQTTDIQVEM